jgi:hypothetical protein
VSGWSLSRRSRALRRARVPRGWAQALSLAVLVAAMLGFYAWTTATSVAPNLPDRPSTSDSLASRDRPMDPSARLADAFLHGRLNLDMPIPRGLRRARQAPDPLIGYFSSDYHDLSYYDRKFYTYWGPVPVLMLFVPARLIGLGFISQAVAVLLFAAAAFLLSVALLRVLVRRFFPKLSHEAFLVAVLALGTGDLLPYLLRRPEIYELAIVSALCFALAAMLCFVTGLLGDRPRAWRVTWGSLFTGLAFGSRAPIAAVLFLGLAGVVWCWRTRALAGRDVTGLLAAVLIPFAICVAAYGAYNQARFGSPTDFGFRHQLHERSAPPLDPNTPSPSVRAPSVVNSAAQQPGGSNLWPGLWYYLAAPPRVRLTFPFLWLPPGPGPPVPTPARYGAEPTGGLLPTLPFLLVLLSAPVMLRPRESALRLLVAAFVALGLGLMVFVAYSLIRASMRYEVDFRTPLLFATLLTWFAAMSRPRARRHRRAAWRIGVALIYWGVAVTVLLSFFGEKGRFANAKPATFSALSRLFNPLPNAVAQLEGHPLIAAVNGSVSLAPFGYDRVSLDGTGFAVGAAPVTLRVVSPSTGVFRLSARVSRVPGVSRRSRVRVGVSANRTGQYGLAIGRTEAFPIFLKHGFNDVRVEAAYDATVVPATPDAPVVGLNDVRVR